MEKIPVEFKKRWVEALRSGKYSQTVGELFSYTPNIKNIEIEDGKNQEIIYEANGYCCLGVACSIAGLSDEDLNGVGNPTYLYEEFEKKLSEEELHKKFSDLPVLLRSCCYEVDQLVDFNDEKLWTFNKIADWIEENL